jgi:hypothetical protein
VRSAVVAWPAVNTKTKNYPPPITHALQLATLPDFRRTDISFPTRGPNGSRWVVRMVDGWRWAGGRSWWGGMSTVITLNAD